MNERPPEIPIRGQVNMIVREYAQQNSIDYGVIWSRLYRELYYRYRYDVKARCRHSGRQYLEQIEVDDMMVNLYCIAEALYGSKVA